jgi:hypothetical protein
MLMIVFLVFAIVMIHGIGSDGSNYQIIVESNGPLNISESEHYVDSSKDSFTNLSITKDGYYNFTAITKKVIS